MGHISLRRAAHIAMLHGTVPGRVEVELSSKRCPRHAARGCHHMLQRRLFASSVPTIIPTSIAVVDVCAPLDGVLADRCLSAPQLVTSFVVDNLLCHMGKVKEVDAAKVRTRRI